MRIRTLLASTVLAATIASPTAAAAQSSEKSPPPGANDWTCVPSAAHPNPVVLVHGLSANMGLNWAYFSPELKKQGYCVFALTYGLDPRINLLTGIIQAPGGVIAMEKSAAELDVFVTKVLKATGAKKIDLVGHSEGTVMPQYWLKFLGGAAKTDKYVALTPIYAGTNVANLPALRDAGEAFGLSRPAMRLFSLLCESCTQLLAGSEFHTNLNAETVAAPGVTYTTIMTKYDELVVPYTSGYLDGADNHVLQDICPLDPAEHLAVAFDPLALQITKNALDPPNAKPLTCYGLPFAPRHPLELPAR